MELFTNILLSFKERKKKKQEAHVAKWAMENGWTLVRMKEVAGTHYLVRKDGVHFALKRAVK